MAFTATTHLYKPECLCTTPTIQNYGDCCVCLKDNCFGAWVWSLSAKSRSVRFRVGCIRERSNDQWLDFLQFFRGYCWEMVVVHNHNGISYLTLANATRDYLHARSKNDKYIPQNMFDNGDPTSAEDAFECSTNILEGEASQLAWQAEPYTNTLAGELLDRIGDPTVSLTLAECLDVSDAALLMGKSIQVATAYINAVTSQVRAEV